MAKQSVIVARQGSTNGKAKGEKGREFVVFSIPLIESNYSQSLINNTAAVIATDHVVVNSGSKRPSIR